MKMVLSIGTDLFLSCEFSFQIHSFSLHRDIKGKNIMLDVDGNIKLIDFGCAKRLKKNQNTHSMRQILKSMKG